jgi:hypothetical protein
MALYRTCPSDGVVVCFDEFGPISLQPYPGHCYAQRKRPWRRRAMDVRRGGIGYFFGAYDVHADVLFAGYRRRSARGPWRTNGTGADADIGKST